MENQLFDNTTQPGLLDWRSLTPRCASLLCKRSRMWWQSLVFRNKGFICGKHWYCCPDCLRSGVAGELIQLFSESVPNDPLTGHRIPLGLLLLSRGLIDHSSLQDALRLQQTEGGRIGQCLSRLGNVTDDQIANALATQWSCPVFPVARANCNPNLLPSQLRLFYRMSPVHLITSARDLYVAFEQAVDYTVLLAIEKMLDCHTRPCIVAQAEMSRLLSSANESDSSEVVLESISEPDQLARTITSYAQQIDSASLKIVRCGTYIWVRYKGERGPLDLLARRTNL